MVRGGKPCDAAMGVEGGQRGQKGAEGGAEGQIDGSFAIPATRTRSTCSAQTRFVRWRCTRFQAIEIQLLPSLLCPALAPSVAFAELTAVCCLLSAACDEALRSYTVHIELTITTTATATFSVHTP